LATYGGEVGEERSFAEILEWMNALNITKVPFDALSQKCREVAKVKLQRAKSNQVFI
jgi:hypothetical protein